MPTKDPDHKTRDWIALDIETSIVDDNPSPHIKGTRPVMLGVLSSNRSYIQCDIDAHNTVSNRIKVPAGPRIIFGHHIAFDILHLLNCGNDSGGHGFRKRAIDWLYNSDVLLWDTMIVAYLLSGCSMRSPSLEQVAKAHNVPFIKDNVIKQCFDEGFGADEIMTTQSGSVLLPKYLEADVRATAMAGLKQIGLVRKQGILGVVYAQLNALKLAILQQHNGLLVSTLLLSSVELEMRAKKIGALSSLPIIVLQLHSYMPALSKYVSDINFNSADQVATILYGGDINHENRTLAGNFKTGLKAGTPRYRMVRTTLTFKPIVHTQSGGTPRCVDEAALHAAQSSTTSPLVREFIKCILQLRYAYKMQSTYVDGMCKHIDASKDGLVHTNLNLAVTNTGRKSSSGPNVQNLNASIRGCIVAESGWKVVTGDWKQLEVIGLAYCSRDPALIADMMSGVDIHNEIGSVAYKTLKTGGLTPEQRTNTKRIVFGRLYGGGAATLSGQSGVELSCVKDICKALDKRYPVAKKFGARVNRHLQATAVPVASDQPVQVYQASYTLPTGRHLSYRTQDDGTFSYTQCKNRPIQSFATADIMGATEQAIMEALAQLSIEDRAAIKPIISVHDEVVFYVRDGWLANLVTILKNLETRVPKILNNNMGLEHDVGGPFNLPLILEIGVGDTWEKAKHSSKL